MKRIVITGSESVGKTTLAEQLGQHFGALVVPEFVRGYASAKGAPIDVHDHGPIAMGQMALEDEYHRRAESRGDTLLIQDTDLVSTVVYCHHYVGSCPAFIEAAAMARRPALYLLLDIDVPWVPDGVRDRGDRRAELQELFVATLERFEAPVTRVAGDWSQRFDRAIACIEALRNP